MACTARWTEEDSFWPTLVSRKDIAGDGACAKDDGEEEEKRMCGEGLVELMEERSGKMC